MGKSSIVPDVNRPLTTIDIPSCVSSDLSALEANVDNDVYSTMDMFIKDAQKIFDNCRTYNAETTSYAKCANRLERYFKERVKVWCNIE